MKQGLRVSLAPSCLVAQAREGGPKGRQSVFHKGSQAREIASEALDFGQA